MENASKALIIAAEILIGVMILGIAAYLFSVFASYSSNRYERIEATQIAEFNEQFLKYYGTSKDGIPIECTIHDIVSLANLAQKNNLEYELIEKLPTENTNSYKKKSNITLDNSLYMQVDLGNTRNLELKSNNYLVTLIKQNDLQVSITGTKSDIKYYKCEKVEYDSIGRVNYIKFSAI